MAQPPHAAADRPWFHQGLRFRCTQCGNCCTGAPGYVWVDDQEIAAIAAHLGTTVGEVMRRHVRVIGQRKTLVDLPRSDWDCTFFDRETRACRVYPVRPRQCRTWPFWESNVKSEEAWKETCKVCPGSGQGDFVPVEEIMVRASVIRI